MEELLSDYSVILKEKAKAYEESRLTCLEMIKNSEFHYSELEVDKYRKQNDNNHYLLIRDTISNLSVIKDKIAVWLLVLLSIIISMIAYPLLPEYIMIQEIGMENAGQIWKGFIFLYPAASVFFVFLAKSIIWKLLYMHMPFYLMYADKISRYVNICAILLIITCQFHTVFFLNKIGLSLNVILLVEMIVLLSVSITSALVKRRKHKEGE